MPHASMTYSLPEESYRHLCAVHGQRLHSALRDIDDHLRNLLKHDDIHSYTAKRLAEEIRRMIAEDLALVEEE